MRQPRAIRDATGLFLRDWAKWTFFFTGTFIDVANREKALRIGRGWLRAVAHELDEHFRVALAVEHDAQGCAHLHGLLDAQADREILRWLWKREHPSTGFERFERYNADENGAAYVAKDGDWSVGVVCPRRARCRREAGCIVGPAPLWR